MEPNPIELFFNYFNHIRRQLPNTDTDQLLEFAQRQWPIVERALIQGEGIRALDSRAHDATCSFVESMLFDVGHPGTI